MKKTAKNNENGNILMSSLVVMLSMNLLGITLMQTSMREFETAKFNEIDSNNLYFAENCVEYSIDWLEQQSNLPDPYEDGFAACTMEGSQEEYVKCFEDTEIETNLSNLYSEVQGQNILQVYDHNCAIDFINIRSVEGDTEGVGENVTVDNSYGIYGDLSPRHYYKMNSNIDGPNNSSKTIVSVVSAEQ